MAKEPSFQQPSDQPPGGTPLSGVQANDLPVTATDEGEEPKADSPRDTGGEDVPVGGEQPSVTENKQSKTPAFRAQFQEINPPAPEPGGKKKVILVGLIVLAGLGLIGGGIWVYKKGLSKVKMPAISLSSPEPTPTEVPTPTPIPELKREDLKVQVLNGGGVVGAAGKAKELLEGLGYPEIETGNADSYDYEETEISIKENKKVYLDLLIEDLSEEYTLASESSTLDEDNDFDAVVIVGKE